MNTRTITTKTQNWLETAGVLISLEKKPPIMIVDVDDEHEVKFSDRFQLPLGVVTFHRADKVLEINFAHQAF